MKPLSLALLSAALFALALPPYDIEWIGWFALAPLLVAVRGRRALEAVGLGLLAGVVCGVLHSGWSSNGFSVLWGFIPFLWLAGLFAGVAAASRNPDADKANRLRYVARVVCVGVAGEWLTTFLPIPINTALCFYRQTALLQLCAVTGIWGVSLLLWLANAVIADAVMHRRLLPRLVSPALAAVLLAYAGGALRLWQARRDAPETLSVAAIQDFTGDETAGIAPAPPPGPDRDAQTRAAVRNGARLVVWSEEVLGAAFAPDNARDATRALARETGAFLVVGHSAPTAGRSAKSYNCATLLAPDGAVLATHHKIHLYLGERDTIQAGTGDAAFASPLGVIGLEVCFDSCYTDVTRRIAAGGARLIAMPNFDPPSPRGVLHSLHGAMLPFRAAENGVGFVRSDSNGLSQIVAPTGEILAQGALYAPETVAARLPLGTGRGTFFTRAGDYLAWVCAAGAVALLFPAGYFRRSSSKN